jgi:hypothetical protein
VNADIGVRRCRARCGRMVLPSVTSLRHRGPAGNAASTLSRPASQATQLCVDILSQ